MENIALYGYISSSDEDENIEESDNRSMTNLDSPIVVLPDKIKMKKHNISLNHTVSHTLMTIPKLDLSCLKAKYHAYKNVEIAEVNVKKSNRSANEYIDKLKFQLKVCKNTLNLLKKKLEKYKRVFHAQKQTLIIMKNKQEILDQQLKKSTGSTLDENSNSHNKKDVNTSLVTIFFLITIYRMLIQVFGLKILKTMSGKKILMKLLRVIINRLFSQIINKLK
jgi:hypothetical protein